MREGKRMYKSKVHAQDGFEWTWERSSVVDPSDSTRTSNSLSATRQRKERRRLIMEKLETSLLILNMIGGRPFLSICLGVMSYVAFILMVPERLSSPPHVRFLSTTTLPSTNPSYHLQTKERFPGTQGRKRNTTSSGSERATSSVPAYRRVCQEILHPSDTNHAIRIKESPGICNQEKNPTQAISSMYAAYFLSQMATEHAITVTYDHMCHIYNEDRPIERTIQQFLPKFHYYKSDEENPTTLMRKQDLDELCHSTLHETSPWSVLHYRLESQDNAPVLHVISPAIRNHLKRWALPAWDKIFRKNPRRREEYDGGFYVETEEITTSGLSSIFSNPYEFHGAVFLPCDNMIECRDAIVVPYHEYELQIPSSATAIDIMVPRECVFGVKGCKEYVRGLALFMTRAFPRAKVTLVQHHSTASMGVMGRLMNVDYAVCGPSGSSLKVEGDACFYPSLARSRSTRSTSVLKSKLVRISPPQSSPLTKGKNETHHDFQKDVQLVEEARALSSLLGLMVGTVDDMARFSGQLLSSLDSNPRKRLILRGRIGKWIKDINFAPKAQYKSPVRHLWGKADKKHRALVNRGEEENVYRDATTYTWDDSATSLELLTLEKLCATLKEMEIGRIFFVGDSLSLNQALSLKHMLGLTGKTEYGKYRASFQETVVCPRTPSESKPYKFFLEVARNNLMLKLSLEGAEEYMSKPFHFAAQWTPRLLENESRTLLITNFGAHMKTVDEFQSTWDSWLTQIDEVEKQRDFRDIVMFRTSVPGHWGCEQVDSSIPHATYSDYLRKSSKFAEDTRKYRWDIFDAMNDYAVDSITRRQNQKKTHDTEIGSKSTQLELLDVFPMTVLRQDGHVGLDSNVEGVADCLHYSLPGPVDWWNHLMFSSLQDLATEAKLIQEKAR